MLQARLKSENIQFKSTALPASIEAAAAEKCVYMSRLRGRLCATGENDYKEDRVAPCMVAMNMK